MWYWRQRVFESLDDVATQAFERQEWSRFGAYCRFRAQGLRSEAFKQLNDFISELEQRPFADRLAFVRWLLPRAEPLDGQLLCPQPLEQRVIKPTLREWQELEPAGADAHYWQGTEENLRRALEIDPEHIPARVRLASHLLGVCEYATHELPDLFIGDPQECSFLLVEASQLSSDLPKEPVFEKLREEISVQSSLVDSYIQYVGSGTKESFANWAVTHQRPWNSNSIRLRH